MNDDHIKNNKTARTAIKGFINTIEYEHRPDSVPTLSGVVSRIFSAAGQMYLLHLVKLRRVWLEENDEFLARHAYPQNFSVIKEFAITPHYLEALEKETALPGTILKVLNEFKNSRFTEKQFFKILRSRLKRIIIPSEQEILMEHAVFNTRETLLHLIVYDGGFTQAIQFGMSNYLKQINKILTDFKVDRIVCHVGDLIQKRQDQVWVGKLASSWERFVDPEMIGRCMPAFIQRFNYRDAGLIIYVSNETIKSQMKEPANCHRLLNLIYQSYPELKSVVQKLDFLVQRNMNPEQTRATSLILGDSAHDPIASYDRFKQLIEQYSPHSPSLMKRGVSAASADRKLFIRKLSHEDRVQEVQSIFQRIKKKSQSSK
ncbi:MAG: hypothetical protein HQM13_11975 [SAR324 cluster bacterium]|nr:hypothetical protein [SAR324 cluster bacterium]